MYNPKLYRKTSIGTLTFLLLSGPIRMRIQYLLVVYIWIGQTNLHGYLCFKTKQLELGSINWNVYYPNRRSSNRENPAAWWNSPRPIVTCRHSSYLGGQKIFLLTPLPPSPNIGIVWSWKKVSTHAHLRISLKCSKDVLKEIIKIDEGKITNS